MRLSILVALVGIFDLIAWLMMTRKLSNLRRDVLAAHARLDKIAPITLADLGIDVIGCSACAITPENENCPGCGNLGTVPVKVKPTRKPRKRR
jgi:hypothetical protein